MILFFDTETTGLPDFKAPSDADHQPHIVELAALLCADDGRIVRAYHSIVAPGGWEISEEMTEIHGIEHNFAMRHGSEEADVLDTLMTLSHSGDDATQTFRVAHNRSFDDRIIRIGLKRHFGEQKADRWSSATGACTAIMSTDRCRIPPTNKMMAAGIKRFKTPKLEEAVRIILGREPTAAHSALGDVLDCRDLYLALREPASAEAAE